MINNKLNTCLQIEERLIEEAAELATSQGLSTQEFVRRAIGDEVLKYQRYKASFSFPISERKSKLSLRLSDTEELNEACAFLTVKKSNFANTALKNAIDRANRLKRGGIEY